MGLQKIEITPHQLTMRSSGEQFRQPLGDLTNFQDPLTIPAKKNPLPLNSQLGPLNTNINQTSST